MSAQLATCRQADCWREPYDGSIWCTVHAELNADGTARAVSLVAAMTFVLIALTVVLAAGGVFGLVTS
jgi:hypothetical protein